MAAYNKFNLGTQDLCQGVHSFKTGVHTWAVILTNTLPVATNHLYSDVSAGELTTTGGYTVGGITSAMSESTTTGTEKVLATNVTWTGSGAGMGPFRYVIILNTTPTTPLKPLWAWYDYGAAISLAVADTFTVSFDASNGFFTVA